jgi:hypothetical protein
MKKTTTRATRKADARRYEAVDGRAHRCGARCQRHFNRISRRIAAAWPLDRGATGGTR